jgi:hypothetical protein
MARHTKEWNEGYQAAIEAIKKAMQGGSGSGDGNDEGLPSDMTPPPSQGNQGGNSKKGGKSGKGESSNAKGGSRTSQNDSNQGVVRPEDCASNNSQIEDTPGTAGGFFDKAEGDKLAQAEGYDKEGGSEDSIANDWKETALKEANKLGNPGDAMGKLKSTIEGLYKVTQDWKKTLKYIVGKSINDADKRQAYANKNILISQDRIARTDKDKYDNMDYMIALIDSSGSMSDDQLKLMLSEIYAIALAKKPIKLYVIQCDTAIQDIKEYKSMRELKNSIVHATVKGRGGTDMGPLWKLMRDDKRFNRVKPDLIMIFTDSDSRHRQYKRDRSHMNWLCWCVMDDPGFNLQYPDNMTKIIHIKSSDIK